ncbi:hypothetical protein BGX31_001861, partial [Mortierella sp. GBA43]
ISSGIAGVGNGVLRGVGLQHLGACLNLVAYYLVAFPLGYMLTFRLEWGLHGLWSALCLALCLASAGGLWVIHNTDWKAEVHKGRIRNALLAKRTSRNQHHSS